jgi:hypothetical protein
MSIVSRYIGGGRKATQTVTSHPPTYVQHKVVGELKVRQLLVELAGEHLSVLRSLGQVEHRGGQLLVTDANKVLEELVNLVDFGHHLVRRLEWGREGAGG